MIRGDDGGRIQLVEDYATVRRFPVLANLHVHQKSSTVLDLESIEVIFKQKNHTSQKAPVICRWIKKIAKAQSYKSYNNKEQHEGHLKSPLRPAPQQRQRRPLSEIQASVHASSPYIPQHKVGVIPPVAEQAKKYIGGTFVPAGNSNKKGM